MLCSHGPRSAQNKAEQTCICPLCVNTHFPLDRITTFKTYYIIILSPFKFSTFHNTYTLRIRNFRSNMKHGPRFPDKEPFLFEMSSCFLGFYKMQNYLLHVQSWWRHLPGVRVTGCMFAAHCHQETQQAASNTSIIIAIKKKIK